VFTVSGVFTGAFAVPYNVPVATSARKHSFSLSYFITNIAFCLYKKLFVQKNRFHAQMEGIILCVLLMDSGISHRSGEGKKGFRTIPAACSPSAAASRQKFIPFPLQPTPVCGILQWKDFAFCSM
jgi:hypothetical protein